jgi:hypothetical protein
MLWHKAQGAGGVGGITAFAVGSFITQSSKNVTGINLSSGEDGDHIVILYGHEGTIGTAFSPANFTLGGVAPISLSPNTPTAVDATWGGVGGSYSASVVFPYGGGASGSNVTLSLSTDTGSPFRASAYVILVRGASSVSVADSYAASGVTTHTKTITPSKNSLLLATCTLENAAPSNFWNGGDPIANNIPDPFGGSGTSMYSSWEFFPYAAPSLTASITVADAGSAAVVAELTFT